jgi:hypothetical protein
MKTSEIIIKLGAFSPSKFVLSQEGNSNQTSHYIKIKNSNVFLVGKQNAKAFSLN